MKDLILRLFLTSSLLLPALTSHAEDAASVERAGETTDTKREEKNEKESVSRSDPKRASIRHVPLNGALLGQPARLELEVDAPDLAGEIFVYLRPRTGSVEAKVVRAERSARGDGYVVTVPAALLDLSGFSYWILERMGDGSERPVFASEREPHFVQVMRSDEAELEHERLQARGGARSTVTLAAEAVDYGDRKLGSAEPTLHDRYYRLETGYAYAFLTKVEEVRLSVVRVRAQAAEHGAFAGLPPRVVEPGIDYGRAAVSFAPRDSVRLRGALLLGASQRGFEYGVGGALVIGDPRVTHLDLGVETLTTLGTTTHLRLGFLASERVPMGAAIEASSFPVGEDVGVRLLYDVGYRFGAVTALTLRAGYQGRTSVRGGPSLGLRFEYGF